MKKVLNLFLVFGLLIGCQNDDFNNKSENTSTKSSDQLTMRTNENDKPDEQMQIVLGKQLKNPYSVKNMQDAFDYYNTVVTDSPFMDRQVEATHYYIKILPSSISHLETLDELDKSDAPDALVIQDYPLDYEILEEGDYYVNPKDENDLYYPAYTVIPVGYQLPNDIPYEILDEIYEPTEEEYDVETVSLFFAGWEEDLKADEILLTEETLPEYLNTSLINDGSSRLFGKRYRPNGWVKVENTESNAMDNLMQVKISIGRNFFWHYTYTNDSGYFESPKKYRGKVRIRAKWRGYTATIRKTWNEILGIQVSDHLMTITRGNNGITKNIMYNEPNTGIFGIDLQGGHLWYKGTIHNGLRKYIDYCNSNGISYTISSANVWAWAKGTDASTPMLYKYPQLANMSAQASVGQANFWNVLVNSISGNVISLVPSHLRPDQIYAGLKDKKSSTSNSKSSTIYIHQIVFHESGHYSHASKAGASFWAQVFAAEISNTIATTSISNNNSDPYRDGSQPSYQAGSVIGLAEGWGNFTEFKISQFYYGKAYIHSINGLSMQNTTEINTTLENFNVYEKPMSSTRFKDASWFLHGIMWDLLDERNEIHVGTFTFSRRRAGDGTSLNNIIDNANISNVNNANDLSPIFNRLNSNVNNASDLRNAILSEYSSQSTEIGNLFKSYGY